MPARKKIILILAVISVIVLLFINIINLIRINRLSEDLSQNTNLILTESTANRRTGDYLNNISGMIAHDLSTTRASLGLSVSDYPFKSLGDEGPEEEVKTENNELIDAVRVLIETEHSNKKALMIGKFIRSSLIEKFLNESGSLCNKVDNLTFYFTYADETYLTATAADDDTIILRGITGEEQSITSASKEAVHFIQTNLDLFIELSAVTEVMKKQLMSLSEDPGIISALGREKNISSSDDKLIISNIYNGNRLTAFVETNEAGSFYRISGNNNKFTDYNLLKTELLKEINSIDMRNNEQVLLDNAKNELEIKLSDPKFKEYLAQMELDVSEEARVDLDYYYYDVNHKSGDKLGSIAILKKLGEIYLVDADEVPVSSLKTLSIKKDIESGGGEKMIIPENIPQIDSLYSNQDTVTFILVGNHERNTDTMILVHANKITGKAYMIGIPRDLYWKGRKINSIYQYFGAEQFKKELSEITGLEITNYIIVDMYAFIDIVNILGGIELTLEEDLVDPTYKTRENGEWSTLNYPKGTYNLNGIEALRVARSRHGSNDFERSKRQQLIIESFLNKLLELNVTDVDKVYGMMQAMFEYVDTDFSLVEIMSLYNNYNDVELAGRHVLSFDNILYDTYSNTYMLDEAAADEIPRDKRGAWILFPRDNNWNNIRWYIRQIINGEI